MEFQLGAKMPEAPTYSRYIADFKGVLDGLPLDKIKRAADIVYDAYETGHSIFTFGNGASGALASHMAADLGKSTHVPGLDALTKVKRIRILSVVDNVAMLTAWANDLSYDCVFSNQIENFIEAGDVAIGISGSGNSPNVLSALQLARRVGATTVGLTGYAGGKMKEFLDCPIVVPCNNLQQIEDAHVLTAHLIFVDLKARIAVLASAEAR
jgi:D-sedoheptulose 7-phosphate isomerase